MRRPANWLQLVRFGVVGAFGFIVNLAVYAFFVHSIGVDYRVAAVAAWLVAVANNFILNRHWTFDAREGRKRFQALRFLLVSVVAFGFSLVLLTLLVEDAGLAKVPAQAIAVAASTPLTSSETSSGASARGPDFRGGQGPADLRPARVGARPRYLYSDFPSRRILVQEMVIYGVSFDMVGKQPIVLLKTVDGNKFLPIWIGHPEAASILMKLQGAGTPRPMTHDLLCDILGELDVKCTQVAVTELRENTFFASITLSVAGRELEIDSRPSDAIALAVRSGAPIFAAEEVISESAIEFEHDVEESEDVVEKFKEFLDQVSPEDFAAGDS